VDYLVLKETFTLTNGVEIPKLGFGTWMIENDDVVQSVKDALEIGYRHIDTAHSYGNEEGVSRAIRESNVLREEIFLTTKLRHDIKNYDDAVKAIQGSLDLMELDYIDLLIIHSPQPWADFRNDNHYFEGNLEAWWALEEAYEARKIRAIGVSNFEQVDLENIINNGKIKPMINQVLAHITNVPTDVIEFCQQNDIVVEAYSPIGHGAILKHETVNTLR